MLNYLGPNIGPAPVTAGLPPAVPGTIPAAVPGVSPSLPPPMNPIMPARPMSISPALAGAINPAGPGTPPPPSDQEQDPADLQYEPLTQQDGSVVLFLKNADGSRGPAVKIVPPPKSYFPTK